MHICWLSSSPKSGTRALFVSDDGFALVVSVPFSLEANRSEERVTREEGGLPVRGVVSTSVLRREINKIALFSVLNKTSQLQKLAHYDIIWRQQEIKK